MHVPSPDAPSEHEPWLEHGDAEPPAHPIEQSDDPKPDAHVHVPLPDAPSEHEP